MSSAAQEQVASEEQGLIDNLGRQVSTILDAYGIEPVASDSGRATRELTSPNGSKLSETSRPEGGKSFRFSQQILYIGLSDSGTETMTWESDSPSSSVNYEFVGKETGTYQRSFDDAENIAKLKYKIRSAFSLPEKPPEKRSSKLRAFLGRLSFK